MSTNIDTASTSDGKNRRGDGAVWVYKHRESDQGYYSQLRFCVEINGANLVTNTGFEEIVALIRKTRCLSLHSLISDICLF